MMIKIIIEIEEGEVQEIEAIVLDRDKDRALDFIKSVLRPKIKEKLKGELDPSKGIGTPTR